MDQSPKLSMPVIAHPPEGADQHAYYSAAAGNAKLAAQQKPQQGIEIYLDRQARPENLKVYSFAGGFLNYDSATPGVLVLTIFPIYVYWLRSNKPAGTSAPQVIRYENVRVSSIEPALLPWLKGFHLKALQEGAGLPDETNVDVLAAKYL